jgi:hypothetical protein
MHNSSGDSARDERHGESFFAADARACPACGARPRRADARFCATCGSSLGEDYFPTESLRASYRFERPPAANQLVKVREADRRRPRRRTARVRPQGEAMPRKHHDGVSATALAFVTYALVPYLGILFCPGALLLGGVGLVRAYRTPHRGGRRAAVISIALGLLILCAQLALWWILYKVPEWSRQMNF